MSKLSAGAGAWSPTSFNVNATSWQPTAEEPTPPGGAPTAADAQPTDADPAAEPAAEAAAAEPAAEAATEAATEARTEAATDEEDWETAEVAPLPDKDEDDEGDSAPAVAAAQEDRRPADDDDAVLGVASANAIFEDEAGAWGDSDDDGDGGGYAPRVVEDYAARAATPPADEGWEDAPVKTKSRSRLGPQQAQAEPPAQTSSRYDAAPRELQSRDSAPRELSSRSGGGGGGGGYGNGGMKPKSKEYVKPSWAQVGDADRSATVLKKAKALLNKLTVEKFERLSCEFIAIDFFSEPLVQGAIDMIVDKAQQETHFVDIYAELCVKMAGTPLPGLGEDADAKGKKFRQMLLERCQAEFEKDHTDLQAELELMEEAQRNRQLNAIRKAYIGHMIFVGALYTEDLLKERVLHHCIQELFGEGVDAPDDEKIECLTRLLTKTGKSLDLAALENPKSQKLLKAYFKQLQKLKKSPLLSSRIRFLVRDLCDLRDANWKPRREEDKAKTIEEIHDDAQREADQKAGIKTKKKKPEDDKKKLAADDGWETVGTVGSLRCGDGAG
ncbi:armadillo-type protein [Pelagophyceae sp. CCMP2097]|nr:armadillo-type protein [Pelagophyceae sp. CCMP2097]